MSTYTFLPWGFSTWQGFPQPPAPAHLLTARPDQVEGGGQRWFAEGDARWGDHTRPTGERHFSPPFMRQSLLEVSKIFPGNTEKHFQASACQVFISPPEMGGTVKLRTGVSQLQANTLLQQSEANLAVG